MLLFRPLIQWLICCNLKLSVFACQVIVVNSLFGWGFLELIIHIDELKFFNFLYGFYFLDFFKN